MFRRSQKIILIDPKTQIVNYFENWRYKNPPPLKKILTPPLTQTPTFVSTRSKQMAPALIRKTKEGKKFKFIDLSYIILLHYIILVLILILDLKNIVPKLPKSTSKPTMKTIVFSLKFWWKRFFFAGFEFLNLWIKKFSKIAWFGQQFSFKYNKKSNPRSAYDDMCKKNLIK